MNTETYSEFRSQLAELARLYISNAKLTVCEKLVRLLAMLAICAILLMLGVVAFFFISIAVVRWIGTETGLPWAYLIMGGFYLLLIALLLIFKKQLVVNPLSRFISLLLLS